LVSSGTEAARKIKEKAVTINGELVTGIAIGISVDQPLTVRVGRKIKRVVPVSS
jgi:hypothetical protein